MNTSERGNYLREKIREEFPNATKFIFEHLAEGYCRVIVDNAYLVFNSDDGVQDILDKINKNLVKPYNFAEELQYLFEVLPIKDTKHKEIDTKVAVENFKVFKSLFTEEEIEESDRNIKMTRANRVWLLENKKVLLNSAQNKKFHELANEVRSSNPKDIDMAILDAFLKATQE